MKIIIPQLIVFLSIASQICFAQGETIHLEEVVIKALPFEKYASGSKIKKSDSVKMAWTGQKTLADHMQQNSTVYIKEQGNRMLASISFRGTGSTHTGIFWHGLNLNSLTLGNSNLNSFPLFLFDDVTVQYGGSSSLHGSDAIGGSIHLGSNPIWGKGSRLMVQQEIGSFGNFFSGAKIDLGNGRWESKTRIFKRNLKNDFRYSIVDRLGDKYEVKQENAAVYNYGVLQEFNFKTSTKGSLSFKGWYGRNKNQTQPLMVTEPYEPQLGGEIIERNLRLVSEYKHFFDHGFLNANAGYVWDYQWYSDENQQRYTIETKRLVANVETELDIGAKSTLKTGGNAKYILPDVWSYGENVREWRGDVFMSLNHQVLNDLQFSINARKTFVPFAKSPIAPSFSTSYSVLNGNLQMIFRGQIERSFRVPTFNDRYWPLPGINERELDSENGYSGELGHNLIFQKGRLSFESDLTIYHMKVDNWILWVPYDGTNWKPENKKKVEGSGVEVNTTTKWKLTEGRIEIGGMYALNETVQVEGVSETDPANGYQLAYTPKHRLNFFSKFNYKHYWIALNGNFTGERNGIDVRAERIDSYFLVDFNIGRKIQIGQNNLSLEARVFNLFNADYQNVNRYAMPGRNFLLSAIFYTNLTE